MLKSIGLTNLAEEWGFSIGEYKDAILEIGDICAIRKTKQGKSFRRDYERGLLMIAVALRYKPKNVLEFGTGRGFVTTVLSMMDSVETICTIDKLPKSQTADIMRKSKYANMSKVKFVSKKSNKLNSSDISGEYDLVFIDGEHTGKAVAHDFKFSLKCTTPEAIIVFDDYRNKHAEVKKYIKNLQYDKILVYTDGWVYDNIMIHKHGDADKVVDNKEMGSGQVILFKSGIK